MLLAQAAHIGLRGVAGCMLFPCFHHCIDFPYLTDRVASLGRPFATFPKLWAAMVLATETLGSLVIVLDSGIFCRLGAALLMPKMLVATYGHALVNNFDDGFNNSERPYYKNAFLPGGSQNFAIGASWQCGFFGAAWYLIAYAALAAWSPGKKGKGM
eukprot:gnl/TRDRNA2_/TRDRNA2_194934_c0_seq1.p1 gnl/TRDRNA2_/TRDRNA2_194934_c0~~gnl/TRDRNA2_/TRDRNA2_194934_c0_seq1.p1  ORF type:complete len:157 (+),score=21.48 gnl/TRDRNA2_/TRDRNA2_194934_c0_seq1:55-525(+)